MTVWSPRCQEVKTTKGHFDKNDLTSGASVTESFSYPDGASIKGGRLRVQLPDGTWQAVEVGQLAVGTLHNLFHEVETTSDCKFRASFITQIYGPNIELRNALVKGPNASAVDNSQKCDDVLAGLIPMVPGERAMANGTEKTSELFHSRGGLAALKAAMALPVNSKKRPLE
jgi:hypothetical protein